MVCMASLAFARRLRGVCAAFASISQGRHPAASRTPLQGDLGSRGAAGAEAPKRRCAEGTAPSGFRLKVPKPEGASHEHRCPL